MQNIFIGEAIDIVKKWLAQGHPLDREHLAKELGDVAWYLAEAATALDVISECVKSHQKNIALLNIFLLQNIFNISSCAAGRQAACGSIPSTAFVITWTVTWAISCILTEDWRRTMKRMGRRLALLAAAAAVLAALGTVPLAAPGPEGQADRFVGFHVAFGARDRKSVV